MTEEKTPPPQSHEGQDYYRAHPFCSRNRKQLFKGDQCGCFRCLAVFSPDDILEWIDEDESGVGQTALCPDCGVDAVLSSQAGFPLTEEFLGKMQAYWFGDEIRNDGNVAMPRWMTVGGGVLVLMLSFILLSTAAGLFWGLTKERTVVLGVLAFITLGCGVKVLEWGVRLLLNKPRTDGGLLSPKALQVCGFVALAIPIVAIFTGGFDMPFPESLVRYGQALTYGAMGIALISLGKARARKG